MDKNKKYLICVDMDGTLFHSLEEYDVKSTELLKKLSKDHMVVIATGRPFRSSNFYHEILELDTPIINYNGALVQSRHDSSFEKILLTIDKNDLFKFNEDNQHVLKNIFCEIEDDIFVEHLDDHIRPHLHADGGIIYAGHLNDILKDNPHGALVFTEKDEREYLIDYVNKTFNGRLKIRFWKTPTEYIGELYNPTITKGQALEYVAKHYNINRENIIAIGDGENDIEMIEFAKIGVAMGQAKDNVKEKADFITESLDNNGVYHFLSKYFNIK